MSIGVGIVGGIYGIGGGAPIAPFPVTAFRLPPHTAAGTALAATFATPAPAVGAVLLAAGDKGKRRILSNARVMIHQPLIGRGRGGQETDVRIQSAEMTKTRRRLSELLALHSGQTYEKVDADCERNYYLSAPQAVAYGLVD